MRKILLLSCVIIMSATVAAQHVSWSAGFNFLSLAEPEMNAGIPVNVRISQRFGIMVEPSVILNNNYLHTEWKDVSGYRVIIQPKYYYGKNSFLSFEMRYKRLSFADRLSFSNAKTGDTLNNFNATSSQNILGFSVLIGKEWALSSNKKLWLSFNAGLGYKTKIIHYSNLPDDYEFNTSLNRDCFGLKPHYFTNDVKFLMPVSLRLFWKIN